MAILDHGRVERKRERESKSEKEREREKSNRRNFFAEERN